jgi:hypothetical protein
LFLGSCLVVASSPCATSSYSSHLVKSAP